MTFCILDNIMTYIHDRVTLFGMRKLTYDSLFNLYYNILSLNFEPYLMTKFYQYGNDIFLRLTFHTLLSFHSISHFYFEQQVNILNIRQQILPNHQFETILNCILLLPSPSMSQHNLTS